MGKAAAAEGPTHDVTGRMLGTDAAARAGFENGDGRAHATSRMTPEADVTGRVSRGADGLTNATYENPLRVDGNVRAQGHATRTEHMEFGGVQMHETATPGPQSALGRWNRVTRRTYNKTARVVETRTFCARLRAHVAKDFS